MAIILDVHSGVGIGIFVKATGDADYVLIARLKDGPDHSGINTNVIPIPGLADAYVDKAAGRKDSGQLTLPFYFVYGENTVSKIWALGETSEKCLWRVQYTDGTPPVAGAPNTSTHVDFRGFVSSVKLGGISGDDVPSLDVTIEICSKMTVTLGT